MDIRERNLPRETEERKVFGEIWERVGESILERWEREAFRVRDATVAEYNDHAHRTDTVTGNLEAVLLPGGVAGRITISDRSGSPYLVGHVREAIFVIPDGKKEEVWRKILNNPRKVHLVLEGKTRIRIVGMNSLGDIFEGWGWEGLKGNAVLQKQATPEVLDSFKEEIRRVVTGEGYYHL